MVKVCILTQWMDKFGGLQKVVCNITNELSRDNNYRITICSLDKNPVHYHLNENITIDYRYDLSYRKRNVLQKILGRLINRGYVTVDNEKILTYIYFPQKRLTTLKRYLEENKFDVVISVASELTLLLLLTDTKCKKIGWQHNEYGAYFRTKNKYSYGLESLAKRFYKELDFNVVLTNYMADDYKKNVGIDSCVIYNPLSFITSKQSNQQKKQLIFVSRLVKQNKGLDYLMEILNKLKTVNAEWNCAIIGDGPDKNYILKCIEENELKTKVDVIGYKENVVDYYLESSILLNTSRWEGFGLTITEAMECGVVPVSFNHDGGKELIEDNIDGMLVEMYNLDEYVIVLNKLLEDSKKRINMSNKAKIRAKSFELELIVEQWKKTISQ